MLRYSYTVFSTSTPPHPCCWPHWDCLDSNSVGTTRSPSLFVSSRSLRSLFSN
ncbi:hypothetical protein CsSME_00034452 [Camellia sinensis var. sinensis]